MFLLLVWHFFWMSQLICSILIGALFCFFYFLPTSERTCLMTPELKTMTPLSIFFVFGFAFLVFCDFWFCAFLGMSQLIRSILKTCPFSCYTFWQLLGISFWSLDGYFWRPLSLETAFFEFSLLLFFFLKTYFWRPLSHFRRFLISYKTSQNRVPLRRRIVFGVSLSRVFVRSFIALAVLFFCSFFVFSEMVVESLFCFVFRTSVLQKRRTVERKFREIVVLLCFPDTSVAKT